MPVEYLVEMICDRVAACKIYMKDNYTTSAPLSYYVNNMDINSFHPQTRAAIELYLRYLIYYGEAETMKTLKELVLSTKQKTK